MRLFFAALGLFILGHAAFAQAPLTIAMNHEPEKLDATTAVNGVLTMPVMANVTENLIALDADGKPTPGLASWTISPDGLTVEFKLRKGVKFHSGDALTAQDIVFSHERMVKNPSYQTANRNLDKVEAIDDETARFIFKKPDASLLVRRALIVVSKAYHDRVGEEEFSKHPVGTGPYKFVAYQPGQSIDLAAFDGYWGGAPSVKAVHFVFINEDTTRLAKLKSGEADIILNTPWTDIDAIQKDGFKIATLEVTPTASLQMYYLNPKMPWHDLRVRQAIASAIDADAIVKGLMHNVPKHYPGFAPGEIGYDPELKNYPYDPALSKKLLAEAGFPSGFSMPLYYWIGEDYGIRETAEAAALYLKAVGIETKVEGRQVPQMVDLMRKNAKSLDAEVAVLGPAPVANFYEPVVALSFTFASFSPFSFYKNDEFDKFVSEAGQTYDPVKRGALVQQAMRILHNDVVNIPIWNSIAVYSMKKNIDFTPTPHALMRMSVKDVTVH